MSKKPVPTKKVNKPTRKKKKNSNSIIGLYIFMIVIVVGLVFVIYKKTSKMVNQVLNNDNSLLNTKKYQSFGVDIPVNYEVKGIDISRHQGNINWDLLMASGKTNTNQKVEFVYIKATEGVTRMDNSFEENWQNAKKSGIKRGAYHFFIPWRSGESQAASFLSTVRSEEGDLVPALDFEKSGGRSKKYIQREIHSFLDIIEKRYSIKPLIYTNLKMYNDFIRGDFEGYPLWIACYSIKDMDNLLEHDWVLWQITEQATVSGISSKVDLNVTKNGLQTIKEITLK